MGLKGEFPRGIENCTSITSLDLSSNELYGTIPSDISKLIRFTITLDLSSNQFSGAIPSDIANCSFLNSLRLDNNKLQGPIPPEIALLGRLKNFNVANNMLVGPVPRFINSTFPAESYANNPGLCGPPLELCGTKHVGFMLSTVLNRRVQFACGFVTGWSLFTVLGIYLFFFGLPGVKKMLLFINKRTKVMVIDGNESPRGEEVNNDPKVNITLAFNRLFSQ
uniref:ATP binding protein n=2 Tax=Solanum tuberosum TaxID=4113 RepID=M1CMI4_SOLTU